MLVGVLNIPDMHQIEAICCGTDTQHGDMTWCFVDDMFHHPSVQITAELELVTLAYETKVYLFCMIRTREDHPLLSEVCNFSMKA